MQTSAPNYDPALVGVAIDNITAGLERVLGGFAHLKQLLAATTAAPEDEVFDPKDPANKYEIGGLEKLTPRGVEICYRLFDAGKSRYAVAHLMDISFGAATHRFKVWEKEGGLGRKSQPL
ncbi:hypothetical protein BH11PSE1_BH11PSE1_33170 [soil metagenome]